MLIYMVYLQLDREIPFLHFVELYREERTVEIISGDFAKFRGSSDLAEVQGVTARRSEEFEVQERLRVIHLKETGGRDR
jgi:hypothetical protein